MTRGLRLLLVVAGLLLPQIAWAAPSLETQVSSRRVEVGESFQLRLVALADASEPTPASPRLQVPAGFRTHGPSVTTQQQVSLRGGRLDRRHGISATWSVTPSRPGSFRVGPASVAVGGRRVRDETVRIEVVSAGQGGTPRRPPSWGFDPFGQLPRFPGFDLGFDDEDDEDGPDLLDLLPPFPDELERDRALDPIAFLDARVDKRQAVVGEQITLRVYAYGARGPFRETHTSEPSREDFVTHVVVGESYGQTMYRVPIDEEVFHAMLVREMALFPIRAGKLTIGAMRMGFDGRGYPSQGRHRGLVRFSEPIEVSVREPPLKGRPAGYTIGDVGQFRLSARVEPRQVMAGEAVSVVARLEGKGNLPYKLNTPGRHGVEWLEPTVVDDIQPEDSKIGGWRKLTYVVRLDEPGRIDLGELELPYYDPTRRAYAVARADLGVVEVEPNPDARPNPKASPGDRLLSSMQPRKTLGKRPEPPPYLMNTKWFWLVLVVSPLGVVLVSVATRLGSTIKRAVSARRRAPQALAAEALREAREAVSSGDAARAASVAERAVFTAIEGATGLKARAVLRSDLTGELESHGLDESLAREITALLDDCDGVRFTGGGADSGELVDRATEVVKRLRAASRKSNGGGD